MCGIPISVLHDHSAKNNPDAYLSGKPPQGWKIISTKQLGQIAGHEENERVGVQGKQSNKAPDIRIVVPPKITEVVNHPGKQTIVAWLQIVILQPFNHLAIGTRQG